MKRFIRFYQEDKQHVKMVNQSHKGFELIVLSDKVLKKLLEVINTCEENNDELYIVWQMKFKRENYIMYKQCTFSAPFDNTFREKIVGKRLSVSCSDTSFYSDYNLDKNTRVKKTKDKYKDFKLLDRMLKIGELNLMGD